MEVTYTVYVYVDDIPVGEGTISLVDEYEDSGSVQIITRPVDGVVKVGDDVESGIVYGRYVDYVTYAYGGTRTYVVKVYTYINNTFMSMAEIEHQDRYGSLVGQQPEQPVKPKQYPQPWILLPLSLIGVYMYTRRKHEE